MSGQLALLPVEADDTESLVNAGCDAHEMGDLVEALRLWTAAKDIVEAAPSGSFDEEWRSAIWFNLGVASEDLSDEGRAMFCYAAALRVDPSNEDAEHNYDRLAHGKSEEWQSVRFRERNTGRYHYCPRAEWEVIKRYPGPPAPSLRPELYVTTGRHAAVLARIDRRLEVVDRDLLDMDVARCDLIHVLRGHLP